MSGSALKPRRNKKKIKVEWLEIEQKSLREAALLTGVHAAFFDAVENAKRFRSKGRRLNKKIVHNGSRRLVADRLLTEIDKEWRNQNDGIKLSSVQCGVYVISLGNSFEIDYNNGFTSPVLYIGKGRIRQRLLEHTEKKLFEVWRSLGGIPFNFFLTTFENGWAEENSEICSSLESHLLEDFKKRSGDDIAPLLNKNQGIREPSYSVEEFSRRTYWNKPILRFGLGQTRWLVKPSEWSDWLGTLD